MGGVRPCPFREWIDREPGLEQIRIPLLVTIMFAGHLPPGRLAEMVAAHRAVHAERLAGYRRIRKELDGVIDGAPARGDRFRLATLDFGLRYESAVLDWFDQLPETLGDGA